MTIETLATQGRTDIPRTLAGIETKKLKQMRNAGLRDCFKHFNEQNYRMEHVAKIHGKTFINDASARNVNATWYTMENYNGSILWIAASGDNEADYTKLHSAALSKIRALYCVGSDNSNLRKNFDGKIPVIESVRSLGEAVQKAFYNPIENATIIYSPSADNGTDLIMDGEAFRMEVNEL